jgi:hypothetical protein
VATGLACLLDGTFRGIFATVAFVFTAWFLQATVEGFKTRGRNKHAREYLDKLTPDELAAVADCLRRGNRVLRCDPDTVASLCDNHVAWCETGKPPRIRSYVWGELQHRKQEILSRADAQERTRDEHLNADHPNLGRRYGPARELSGLRR